MMVVYGSEDGRVCGWDLNSQDMVVDSFLDKQAAQEGQIQLVSSLDYDPKHDIIGACGKFKGIYVNQMSNLIANSSNCD